MTHPTFTLDRRLDADTFFVRRLALSRMLLLNDRRWPWLLLVPERPGIVEIFDLSDADRATLTQETNASAKMLAREFSAQKINFGSLGNIVEQFHMHVIARDSRDPAWPGATFGHPGREPYEPDEAEAMIARLASADLAA
ncbi:MAG: HIT family protein [Mesorhizobium sp.]|nr:HIT family protein [Mesorhizobium sp.]